MYNSAERRGLQKGLQEGLEKGIGKGIEQGIEKGKAEEQRLIAAKFKQQGIPVEIISQCTGLSAEEIALL